MMPTTPSPIPPAASTTAPPPPTPGRKPAPSSPRTSRGGKPIAPRRARSSRRSFSEKRKPPCSVVQWFRLGGGGAARELAEGAVVADGGLAGALDVLVVQVSADRG